MGSKAHETANQLVSLLKNEFAEENVDIEVIHDKYDGPDAYSVWGCIGLGIFNFPIGFDTFSLSLSLSWTKKSEFAYAHQWIGPHTLRRKPTYRKISKIWEMVEQLKSIGYEEFLEGSDENPYSFTMSMHHTTPVQIDTPDTRERLIVTIRKTITILRQENPWKITES